MTTDNVSPGAGQPTVGERLRNAREVAGLSVAEVAAKQHLRPAVISAIESGDYRSIDSELFLKGYVRAYANHVGIDPDSMIRQLNTELEPLREEQKARVEASPLVDIERRKRRKRRIAKIVLLSLVLAAGFYGASLYLASREGPVGAVTGEPPVGEDETDDLESPVTVAPSEENAEPAVDVERPSTEALPADPGSAIDNGPATGNEQPEAGDAGDTIALSPAEPPASEDVSEPVTAASDGTELPEEVAATELEPDAAISSTSLADEAPAPSPAVSGQLVVEFSGNCWIEVQDSTGRTLVAELRRAGETLDVTGDGPLRVVLGAVSAVSSLRYSGEAVNLSDRRARNDRLVLNLSD